MKRQLFPSLTRRASMPQFLPRAVSAHYLFLRLRLEQAGKTGNKEDIRSAVQDETVFGARLMKTNMIHAARCSARNSTATSYRTRMHSRGRPSGRRMTATSCKKPLAAVTAKSATMCPIIKKSNPSGRRIKKR